MQDLETLSRLDIIEHLAGINYGPREIALYLNEETRAFKNKWDERESPERQAYDRGQLLTQAAIDTQLAENAKAGNITAAQLYKKSRLDRDWENAFNNYENAHRSAVPIWKGAPRAFGAGVVKDDQL